MRHLMTLAPTDENIQERRDVDAEIDELERREEEYWAQRSRQN